MIIIWSQCSDIHYSPLLGIFNEDDIQTVVSYKVPTLSAGDLLMVMGGANLEMIQSKGWVVKNKKIQGLREQVFFCDGHNKCPMMITYDINVESFDYGLCVKLKTDLALAKRYYDTGSLKPKLGNYKYYKDFADLPYFINDEYNARKRPVRVSLDLETVGLYPHYKDKFIVSISISIKEGESYVIRFQGVKDQPKKTSKLWDQINWLLNDDRISLMGANLKFDLGWIRVKWGMICTNFTLDTTLVGSLLDENRSNSLNTHCKIYAPELGGYDDVFNKTIDKSRMDLVTDKDLLPYAGGDTDATLRVANKIIKKLVKSKRQTDFYTKLLHPASRAFEDMEHTGINVDADYMGGLQSRIFKDMSALENQAKDLMPKAILNKHGDEFALSKAGIIKEFMFTHPKGLKLKPLKVTKKTEQPSTAFEHLKMFDSHPDAKEFVGVLKKWTSAQKTESTYITGFMKHLREDGKFHPGAILFRSDFGGTITGRLAFKDPAWQTVPKHTIWAKDLRRAYIAPKGYVILLLDYSQGELRVMACVANEPTMIQAYLGGIDMHLKTGAELNGILLADALKMQKSKDKKIIEKVKKIRQGGKAGNFGLIYGISPGGFVEYAMNTYGVELTLEQATFQQEQFFDMYPRILDYHSEYKSYAHLKKQVSSPLGRVRHLPLINSQNWSLRGQAERQAINSPIQSTLSDLACLALGEFKARHGYTEDCKMFSMTHDQLGAYVVEDNITYWKEELEDIMVNLPLKKYFGWEPQLKFLVDAEVGTNMSNVVPF